MLVFRLPWGWDGRVLLVIVFALAVAAVAEQVHQRAGKQKQERQHAEQMRPVLGEKEEAAHEQEPEENKFSRREKTIVIVIHAVLLANFYVALLRRENHCRNTMPTPS